MNKNGVIEGTRNKNTRVGKNPPRTEMPLKRIFEPFFNKMKAINVFECFLNMFERSSVKKYKPH